MEPLTWREPWTLTRRRAWREFVTLLVRKQFMWVPIAMACIMYVAAWHGHVRQHGTTQVPHVRFAIMAMLVPVTMLSCMMSLMLLPRSIRLGPSSIDTPMRDAGHSLTSLQVLGWRVQSRRGYRRLVLRYIGQRGEVQRRRIWLADSVDAHNVATRMHEMVARGERERARVGAAAVAQGESSLAGTLWQTLRWWEPWVFSRKRGWREFLRVFVRSSVPRLYFIFSSAAWVACWWACRVISPSIEFPHTSTILPIVVFPALAIPVLLLLSMYPICIVLRHDRLGLLLEDKRTAIKPAQLLRWQVQERRGFRRLVVHYIDPLGCVRRRVHGLPSELQLAPLEDRMHDFLARGERERVQSSSV